MINKIIGILLLTTVVGCANDDDSGDKGVRKYADQVMVTQDGVSTTTKIEYNDSMQVTAYVGDQDTIRFEYEQGKVVRVKEGNGIDPYVFQYTGGVLSGIQHYSLYYPVTYNSQNKSYTLEGGNFTFGLAGRDISYVDQTQNYREDFSYDSSKKGAFYNIEGENIFPVTLFASFQYYYLTNAALKSITVTGSDTINYIAENTYDDQGYITSYILRSEGNEAFSVQYHYLEK